ncbi:MAG: CHAD domain-containing protein [Pirellulaceae bacterium]
MPRFEKWLTQVGPDAPIPRAARKALAVRLEAVEHYLKEAAQVSGRAADDAESVHQLRVWTRRSAAALRLFDEVLPRRTAKWLKRKLRKIRRTAGKARDCDVLATRIEQGDLAALEQTAVPLRARRKRAEKELSRLYKSLVGHNKWERKTARLFKKARWKGRPKSVRPPFGPWCRERLRALADQFHAVGGGDLSTETALHELRLAGKRLRYALELSPAALDPATHRRLYQQLGDLQDRLGEVCDSLTGVTRLEQWLAEAKEPTIRKQLRAALKSEQHQLARLRQRFARWWTAKRRLAMQRSWRQALRG